ncbi:MAG: site-2 protease family protein [Myxococcales bacterium]
MPRTTSPVVNVVLFLLTVLTTLVAGFVASGGVEGLERYPLGSALGMLLVAGIPYSASLMAMLLCHEFGHYFAARLHGVDASLPFFIPFPMPPFGTMGAVIRIRSKLPSLRSVLDIGAAGPIAGFVVAVPVLVWGVAHSQVVHGVPTQGPNAAWQSAFNLLTALVHHSYRPWVEPQVTVYGDSILTWAVTRLVHGPLPAGSDIALHPVAFAGWVGCLITAMNMTPVGQLDGGHVIYALFGRWGSLVSRLFSHALLGVGLFASWNWLIWWVLTRLLVGVEHPMPQDTSPIGRGRKAVAVLSLVILVLTFVPRPVLF